MSTGQQPALAASPAAGRAVLIVDIDGIIQGIACAAPLPQPGTELGREPIEKRVPASVAPRLREAIELAFSTCAATTFDYTVDGDAGARRIEVGVAPLALTGAPLRACVTLADAGRDDAAHAVHRSTARAQHMDALARVTSALAHDVNNMLNGVLGFARLAARAAVHGHAKRVPRYLDEIESAGERAAARLERVLIFARGAAASATSVDVTSRAQAALETLLADAPAGLTAVLAADPGVGCVDLDAAHLDTILGELMANASAALGARGHITLGTTRRNGTTLLCDACHREAQGDWIVLSVGDDGPGLMPAVRDRLFEPYVSAGDGTAGSGLGLAVVHGLVHQHGGHVCVTEPPGGGTRIEVWLPPGGTTTVNPCTPFTGTSGDARHVLLVDDDTHAAAALGTVLGTAGYRVTHVTDATAALAHLGDTTRACDILVSNWRLSADADEHGAGAGLDGMGLAARGRLLRPALRTVLLDHAGGRTHDAARGAGVTAVLAAPVDAEQLLRLLGDHERAA
ncbi:MAG: ATP-binding protein [Gammaproteobacteria bacterium]